MTITFNQLKKDFNSRSSTIANHRLFIQDEIKQIDFLITYKDTSQQAHTNFNTGMGLGLNVNRYSSKINLLNEIYNGVKYEWATFITTYEHYLYKEVENDFEVGTKHKEMSQALFDEFNTKRNKAHIQGVEFAKYTLWLTQSIDKNVTSDKKKPTLSHKQKMLALHYLGLDLSKYDNTKSAKILSQILDLSEENTRKYISYLSAGKNNVRTKSNLEKLSQLFEQQDFIDVSNQINNDIKKM